jgi:hypothetical protein
LLTFDHRGFLSVKSSKSSVLPAFNYGHFYHDAMVKTLVNTVNSRVFRKSKDKSVMSPKSRTFAASSQARSRVPIMKGRFESKVTLSAR